MNCDYCEEPLDFGLNKLTFVITEANRRHHTRCERGAATASAYDSMHHAFCHLDGCDWVAAGFVSDTSTG